MKEESSFEFDGEQIPCINYHNEGAIKEEGNLTELYIALTKARLEFENANDSYKLQKDNKDLSEKIYKDYETKYKAGMASSLELTQAQLQYLNTEQAYFQAIFNLLDAKNKLDRALGL